MENKKLWVLTNNVNDLENAGRFMDTINIGLNSGGEIIASGMAPIHGEPALWVFMVVPDNSEKGLATPREKLKAVLEKELEVPAKPKTEEPLRWLDGEICKRIASTTLEPTLDEVRYKIWVEALDLVREARRRAGR